VEPTVHHQETTVEPVQQAIMVSPLVVVDAQKDNTDAQQDIGMDSNISVEGNKEQQEDTTTQISPSQAAMVNHNIDVSTHSFSKQLTNVIDDVVRSDLGADHEPILSPVRTLDVSSIIAAPDAPVDPTLQPFLALEGLFLSFPNNTWK